MASARTSPSTFKFDFSPEHLPPEISPGKWSIESDGHEEFDIVDGDGNVVATVDGAVTGNREQRDANAVCIHLVPELVRGIYIAMRALKGSMPDDETPESISAELSRLLKRCYASPK